MDTDIVTLTKLLIAELVGAVGLPRTEPFLRLFWFLFRRPMSRLSTLGLTFDRLVAEAGFPNASEWALTHWCSHITARGTQDIPAEGPLLIVSNHPGTYDALIIFSKVDRQDIRWISTEIPFLDNLLHPVTTLSLLPGRMHSSACLQCAAPSGTCRPVGPCCISAPAS